jgi:hypothetical protein
MTPLLVFAFAGCVSGSYERASTDEPLPIVQLGALQPGRDDLTSCLARLGAPHRVFEYRFDADQPSGAALLWFWRDSSAFGVEVSSPSDNVPGSVRFDQNGTDLPGCMLWFGPDLVLERWQQGLVGDLLPQRLRPGTGAGG